MKVAINGFGSRGRAVFRALQGRPGLELVAVNAALDAETMAYLARRDSVRGPFPGTCELSDGCLVTARGSALLTAATDPGDLPWRRLGVEAVVEAGDCLDGCGIPNRHLAAGARKVVVAGAAHDGVEVTIFVGANDAALQPGHAVMATGSGAANCLAHLAGVLDSAFGLELGLVTRTGPGPADQCLVDAPHADPRRGRAAGRNIVPTLEGSGREVGVALAHLAGRLDAQALCVPVAGGSLLELVAVLRRKATAGSVNEALRLAGELPALAGILGIAEDPLVSTDIVGDSRSCVFDPGCTRVPGARTARTAAWFDEDWSVAGRVCDLLERLAKTG
jgi:glyceraldehyde 3-phosphate dehydrogenase